MKVWWFEQDVTSVPLGNAWLSEGESAALDRLRILKRRSDWRLGRWTAKRALSAYLAVADLPPSTIEIRTAPSGAPEAWVEGRRAALNLSLSHSDGVALCAIAPEDTRVGCDLEKIAARSDAFIADYFTPQEREVVGRHPDRETFVTLFWSAKESALKLLQCGLRADTRDVDVTFVEWPSAPADPWRAFAVRVGRERFRGWWRKSGAFVWTILADTPYCLAPLAAGSTRCVTYSS